MSEFRPIISIVLSIVLVLSLIGVVQILKKGVYEAGDYIYFVVDEDSSPITYTGANDYTPSPDGQKIAYKVTNATNSAHNGIWVIELAGRSFSARAPEPKQIVISVSKYDLSTSKLLWTPDSSQLLTYWTKQKTKKKSCKAGSRSAGQKAKSTEA